MFAPSHEANAIAGASLKAGLAGAALVTTAFAAYAVLADSGWLYDLVTALFFVGFLFTIAFVAGTIFVGLALLLVGSVIARIARTTMASASGLLIALASALAVATGLAALFGGAQSAGGLLVLFAAYALPAAIIYRREILLERSLDQERKPQVS